MSLKMPSNSSADRLLMIPSGSQIQLGLPLLQAVGSEVGFGKSFPEGENGDKKVEASSTLTRSVVGAVLSVAASSAAAAQRPRRATQQRVAKMAKRKKAVLPERRRTEIDLIVSESGGLLQLLSKCSTNEKEKENEGDGKHNPSIDSFASATIEPVQPLPTSGRPPLLHRSYLSSQISLPSCSPARAKETKPSRE